MQLRLGLLLLMVSYAWQGFPFKLEQLAYLRVWQGLYIMMRISKSSCFKTMEVMSGAEQGGASWSIGNQ